MKEDKVYRAYNVYFAYEAYDYVTVWTDSTATAKQIALANVDYREDLTRTEGEWEYDGTQINIDGYEADDCAYVDETYEELAVGKVISMPLKILSKRRTDDDNPATTTTDTDQHTP